MQLCRADMRGRWKFEDEEGSDAKVKTIAANACRRNTAWVSPFTPRLCTYIYGVVHSVWRLQIESIVAATFTVLDDSFSLSTHITTRDIHSLVSISGLHNLPGLLHNCVKAINLPRDPRVDSINLKVLTVSVAFPPQNPLFLIISTRGEPHRDTRQSEA